MALAPTGSISASQVNSELGRSSTAQFSCGDATFKKLVMESGPIDLGAARGSAYINSNRENLNLFSAIGSPSVTTTYKILFESGVTVGGTHGNSALYVGDFPAGSTVLINNYGNILGAGGYGGGYYSSGEQGGTAINAAYGNESIVINNYGLIYGGGGGGGSGGAGGTGGQGGGGYYYQGYEVYDRGNGYYVVQNLDKNGGQTGYAVYWAGNNVTGNGFYYQGGYEQSDYSSNKYASWTSANYWNVGSYYPVYTNGGGGGGGGSGGAGGRGYGYDGGNSGGSGGNPGNGGGAPDTNAGWGGQGGTGGTGGTGGGWGSAGNQGDTGNYGFTGGNGNNGGGYGGSSGYGGASGGSAGLYLYKAGQNVTLNNYGGLAGGLA